MQRPSRSSAPTPTVLVSAPGAPGSPERLFAEGLAARLAAGALRVVLLPDIYHLDPRGETASWLRGLTGPLVVFSAHYPRAAHWTLRALGVSGFPTDTLAAPGDNRPLICLRLTDRCCLHRWVEALAEIVGGLPTPDPALRPQSISEAPGEGGGAARWYPVIDYDRCTNCGQCLEFCLFGVYDRDETGLVRAEVPEACKPGCPACSRVCPAQAIMFPLYSADAAIAGSRAGTIRPFDPAELAADPTAVAEVVSACARDCDCGDGGDPECGCSCDSEARSPSCSCGPDGSPMPRPDDGC